MKSLARFLVLFFLPLALPAQEPEFRLKDLDHRWTTYEELMGNRLTVIDFWATWCQPCMRSLPLLNELYMEFNGRGVNFIGVSVDGPRNQAKITPRIRSMGISYPIVRDLNSELMSDLGLTAVPSLLIYNSEGDQVFFHEGFRPGDEIEIRSQIVKFLGEDAD